MSGMYTRDKILITPVIKQAGTGALTDGIPIEAKVMVEEETNIISNGSGRDVKSDIYIFAPPKTVIKKGDRIQVIERFGQEVVGEPERTVIQVSQYGSFNESHKDVYA